MNSLNLFLCRLTILISIFYFTESSFPLSHFGRAVKKTAHKMAAEMKPSAETIMDLGAEVLSQIDLLMTVDLPPNDLNATEVVPEFIYQLHEETLEYHRTTAKYLALIWNMKIDFTSGIYVNSKDAINDVQNIVDGIADIPSSYAAVASDFHNEVFLQLNILEKIDSSDLSVPLLDVLGDFEASLNLSDTIGRHGEHDLIKVTPNSGTLCRNFVEYKAEVSGVYKKASIDIDDCMENGLQRLKAVLEDSRTNVMYAANLAVFIQKLLKTKMKQNKACVKNIYLVGSWELKRLRKNLESENFDMRVQEAETIREHTLTCLSEARTKLDSELLYYYNLIDSCKTDEQLD